MAAGDFLIYKNNADVSGVANGGTTYDAAWDNEVKVEGSAATYSAGTFTLTNTAPYLIMYSEKFTTSDVTNNERLEFQGRLRIEGVDAAASASSGYIRKSSGHQSCALSGFMIYHATAGDTFVTRFWRGDNSATGTNERVPDFGGVQILQLDTADNFAEYATTAANTLSSTEGDVGNWSTILEETGFSRSTNAVTITNAGRYLMVLGGPASETGTARIGATVFLERGTTEVTGARIYTHMRGSDGNQNGSMSGAFIVDVGASDTFTLRFDADSGSVTLDAGFTWSIWQIPSGNECAIAEATTGDMNAALIDFAWDTLPYIDATAFTGTAGNTNIDVDQNCHVLSFWNMGKKVIDSLQRAGPQAKLSNEGVTYDYATSNQYHRNSGSIGTFMVMNGGCIGHDIAQNNSLTIETSVGGAAGTIDCDSGQWSLLNLEGLYKSYTYNIPMAISNVDGDDIVSNTQTNVIIAGTAFEALQGTGKVELVENANYSGTIIAQSVDSWSDTSIQFDVSSGALADTFAYVFVTRDEGSRLGIEVAVGNPPETYAEAIANMVTGPDHHWAFQNTYDDEIGTATANGAASGGAMSFVTSPLLVKGDTHSMLSSGTGDYVSPADQGDMNTSAIARRYIGGWFELDGVSQGLAVIYEEGAQVNNIALLNGFGNNIMFQVANASDDYVQCYADEALTPGRPYHVLLEFNASGFEGGVCGMFLDGVLQSKTNGNPWETAQLDSHSGNITFGHEGTEALKVGDDRGVDATTIAFASPVSCNYAHWYSWSDNSLNDATDIRQTLFEKGAPQEVTISSDTEANMQIAMDALASTLYTDSPCSIEIGICTDGDFTLNMDNITFEDRVSMQIRYVGSDTLTLVKENGTVLDSNKLGVPYGGTILQQQPASLLIDGLITGSIVEIYDNEIVNVGNNDTKLDFTNNSGTSFGYSHDGTANDIVVQVIKDGYEEIIIPVSVDSSDATVTVTPIPDSNI